MKDSFTYKCMVCNKEISDEEHCFEVTIERSGHVGAMEKWYGLIHESCGFNLKGKNLLAENQDDLI